MGRTEECIMQHRIEENVTKPAIPVRVEHDIPTYLSSDEALIHILNRYPAELIDISRYDFGESDKIVWTPGQRGHAAGETVLDAVRNGQLCVTLNNIENAHPGLWAEVRLAFAGLDPRFERKASKLTGRLVISSSTARFPCRFDTDNVVLFHLRGFQRVWVYPTDEIHLPQTKIETTLAGASSDLPRNRVEDNAAWRFGIVPGEALAWPLHAPHYSENEEGLCVSVIVTYETAASRVVNGVHLANSVRRRWGHKIPRLEETSNLQRIFLWLESFAFAPLGLVPRDAKAVRQVVDPARCAIEQDWQIDRRSLTA
jgi:hypothetical protein